MNLRKAPPNVTASVHQRLLNLVQKGEGDFQTLMTRYALERVMYRVSQMEQGKQLILKGAMVFCLWGGQLHRSTRDLDFLGSGESDAAYFREFFLELCRLEVEEDGIRLVEESLAVRQMREDEEYQGVRIELLARLGTARIPLIIDVGFGDVVTPAPAEVEFPALLNFPRPRVRAYPRETVVAEKFWIMTQLGINNTRLKDYYDLWTLSRNFSFEGPLLCRAIQATFARRKTVLPTDTPIALAAIFYIGSNTEILTVQGRPDPAGGSVCDLQNDDGQPHTTDYTVSKIVVLPDGTTVNVGTFFPNGLQKQTTEYTCSGAYQGGKISYTETNAIYQEVYSNGVTCSLAAPRIIYQLQGTFTSPGIASGVYNAPASSVPCSDGSSEQTGAETGTWTAVLIPA